jgi:hypothetical protein
MLYACGLVYTLHASCNIPWGISLLSHCLLEQAGPSLETSDGDIVQKHLVRTTYAFQKHLDRSVHDRIGGRL